MRLERLSCTLADAAEAAARVRAMVPAAGSVEAAVREILEDVRAGGDHAVAGYERRFGGAEPGPLRVAPEELSAALDGLEAAVREGLEMAIANVAAVAAAGAGEPIELALEQGQRIRLREVPVRRAAVYAPGGRAPYPSSVVMGAVTARAAGVEEVVVASQPHPLILGAAALCGADAVYRMSGAQAVAALAYGTESVAPVDVIVGPGNLYVQEAKRQVSGRVGIDGFAGPSDLVAILSEGADPAWAALDLLAQAEHGDDSLIVAVSDSAALLDAVAAAMTPRPTVADGPKVLLHVDSPDAALGFAEALAPEHLQLAGAAAEALAPRVRRAGCLFVGASSGTAFGDYVAGSNHTLPTGGSARFASGLSPHHFRRRMAEVRVGAAAAALAGAGSPVARAEGFEVHAESMEARMVENRPR
jgi:histidinol dehydrogenase